MTLASINLPQAGEHVLLAAAVIGTLYGFWRWLSPRVRRLTKDAVAARDAIVGREATYDSITQAEILPALPGIGQRMATVETAVTLLVENQARLDDHEFRLTKLEDATCPRSAACPQE